MNRIFKNADFNENKLFRHEDGDYSNGEFEYLEEVITTPDLHEWGALGDIDQLFGFADRASGATVTLAGREAYQVYAYFPDDGTFLVTWCVADDAGVVHYVAAEGPSDGLMDLVTLVEQSYSFTEQ